MSAQPKANEPSMEDILASIRRIIADDQAKETPAAESVKASVAAAVAEIAPAAPRFQPEPEPDVIMPQPFEEEILDLDEPVLSPPAAANAPAIADEFDIEFNEVPEPAPLAPPVEMPPPPMPAAAPTVLRMTQAEPAPQPAAPDMSALISGQVENHVQQAFASLAGTVLSSNARTLEDIVREMMRPMIKTWLDDNLPGLVERLVRAEIERVARGGRG